MRTAHRSLGVLALTIATALPGVALAQSDGDRATARALGQDAEHSLATKDYAKAEDEFRRADSLVHAPTLMLGLARALAGQGKVLEAQEAYNRIVRDGVAPNAPAPFKQALEDAKKEVKDVEPRIGGVTITVKDSAGGAVTSAKVTVDDAPVNTASLGVRRLVDPGDHVVRASADGYRAAEIHVNVPPGGSAEGALVLEKDASQPPAPEATGPAPAAPTPPPASSSGGASPWPWVSFGVGGAGLGVGVVAGIIALGKHSDLSKSCGGGSCGPSQQGELDSYHSVGLVSTIGFIVAGVGAAAGVTLLLVQPKGDSAPAASLVVGPGSLGAVGRF
ncbi:MAG TPA: hypothetical protein VGG39_28500 [Polyangiaceae bacterium]|jgi:hypothetical protein